jgi:hypothetical protein
MPDANIIAELPRLTWRGLVAPPYDAVTFDYENRLAPREVPWIDGEIHDDLGRKATPMSAKLYFINGLSGGPPGVRLFPDYWNQWAVTLDGSPGDLLHPVLGPLRARVRGAKGTVQATTRAGIIVEITWIETLEDPALPSYLALLDTNPVSLAADADAQAAAFGVSFASVDDGSGFLATPPSAIFPAGIRATTLADALSAIEGAIFALQLGALASLGRLMGAVLAMADLLDAGSAAERWQANDALIAFWTALFDMQVRFQRAARSTGTRVVGADTTLAAFAETVGNTTVEVMGLNPGALRAPTVRRGTPLVFYTR